MKSRLPFVILFASLFVAFASTLRADNPKKDPEKTRLLKKIENLEFRLLEQQRAHDIALTSARERLFALEGKLVEERRGLALAKHLLETANLEAAHAQRIQRLLDRTRPRAERFRFESEGTLAEGLQRFEALTGCETRLIGGSKDQALRLRAKGSPTELAFAIAGNVRADSKWADFEFTRVYEFRPKRAPEQH